MFSLKSAPKNQATDEKKSAGTTTSCVINALDKKRKEPPPESQDEARAHPPASKAKTEAVPWNYASLVSHPQRFTELTDLTPKQFNILCSRIYEDQEWRRKMDYMNDLKTPQDKILATCLLLNGRTRAELRANLQCSEGTTYFVLVHLCSLVKRHLSGVLNLKPLLRRVYLFDPREEQFYTPLTPREHARPRVRLPDTLMRIMPPSLKAKVRFTLNKEKKRVYFTPREDKTAENGRAIYREVIEALKSKRIKKRSAGSSASSLATQESDLQESAHSSSPASSSLFSSSPCPKHQENEREKPEKTGKLKLR